jgi:hypothetical protein
MGNDGQPKRAVINQEQLPMLFPTHRHTAAFWEQLGRTIATFSFLEEVLGKAIFAFTATHAYGDNEVDEAYKRWLPRLEKALTDTLLPLAESYGKAVQEHPNATIVNVSELVDDIKSATAIRNVLCHGSWRSPSDDGASVPLFVNKKKEIFELAIDTEYLEKVRRHVVELACAVINSVTHMGLQFPGGTGPGRPIA